MKFQDLAKKTEGFSGSDLKRQFLSLIFLTKTKYLTDLCVSAALDSVKRNVTLPWEVSEPEGSSTDSQQDPQGLQGPGGENLPRTLSFSNFKKALKEISPSASESQGSTAELKKWNELFGEGVKDRKQKLWGAGRFGFTHEELSQAI